MKTKRRRSRAPNKEKPIDWSNAKRVRLPNLKPSTQSMSLRPPGHTLEPITAAANARSVPLPPADALRAKLAALDLTEKDVANAVALARTPRRKARK